MNITSHLAFQHRVAWHISRLSNLCTQGRNCEHNYDDCLLNPCPEAFSCVDGINKVSCLPPNTNPVPLVTPSENITSGYTPRVLMPALSPVPTVEPSTGMDHVVYLQKMFVVKYQCVSIVCSFIPLYDTWADFTFYIWGVYLENVNDIWHENIWQMVQNNKKNIFYVVIKNTSCLLPMFHLVCYTH